MSDLSGPFFLSSAAGPGVTGNFNGSNWSELRSAAGTAANWSHHGARASYIAPLIDQLPIDVRFFNGGSTSVRSFAERELGPRDRHGNPLGGEFSTVFNAELIFPIYGALQGAVFADAGSLLNRAVPDSGALRYGLGLGLRYKLPIGPLRLDYGVNPDRRASEDFGAFHFSFGFAF